MSTITIPCRELATARIILRPFDVKHDARRIFEICSLDQTVEFYGMEPMQDVLEAERLLECYVKGMHAGTSVHWGIVDLETGLLIGDAGLMSIDSWNGRASSYCVLDAAYWGRGLSHDAMTVIFDHAFSSSPLNRIQAYIDVRNERTIRSVEGIGFVREGVLRGYEKDRGEYIDDAVYAITRWDWTLRRRMVFGLEIQKSRSRYSWQCYSFADEDVVLVYDCETQRYYLLEDGKVRDWLMSNSPLTLENGFSMAAPTAVAFLLRLRESEIDFEVHWDVTNDCNSKCVHCYNIGARDGHRECVGGKLHGAACVELLKKLRERGVFRLVISGGEPLLRHDIFDILELARSLGFQVVLYTNGLMLDARVANRIASLGLVSVEISMYGACAATHDAVTRVPGAFNHCTNALRLLTARGVSTVMKCVALHINSSEIGKMLALGGEIAANTLVSYVFYPSANGGIPDGAVMLSLGDLVGLSLNEDLAIHFCKTSCQLCRYEDNRDNVCTDLVRSLYVNSVGDVFPCIAIPESLGNWREVFSRCNGVYASARDRLAKWRKFAFSSVPECGQRIYCKYCYSTCPGDALLLHGNVNVPPANHCRLAIARYVAAQWYSSGHTHEEWSLLSQRDDAVRLYIASLGIDTKEYE